MKKKLEVNIITGCLLDRSIFHYLLYKSDNRVIRNRCCSDDAFLSSWTIRYIRSLLFPMINTRISPDYSDCLCFPLTPDHGFDKYKIPTL